MQTTVELSQAEIDVLDRVSNAESISREELLHKLIAQLANDQEQDPIDAVFGMWRENPEDGVSYQQRMRAEWDRDF